MISWIHPAVANCNQIVTASEKLLVEQENKKTTGSVMFTEDESLRKQRDKTNEVGSWMVCLYLFFWFRC